MKFEQDVVFRHSAAQVYDILINEHRFSTITHAPANIRANVGGLYEVYNRMFTGLIKFLEPNKQIVLYWRKREWPQDDQSKVTITLEEKNSETRLHLLQEEIPDAFIKQISDIWQQYYWDLMEGKVK